MLCMTWYSRHFIIHVSFTMAVFTVIKFLPCSPYLRCNRSPRKPTWVPTSGHRWLQSLPNPEYSGGLSRPHLRRLFCKKHQHLNSHVYQNYAFHFLPLKWGFKYCWRFFKRLVYQVLMTQRERYRTRLKTV